MTMFSKFIKLAKEQPVGCFFSAIVSLMFLSFAIGGMAFVAYAVSGISLLKDVIYSNTGFHISAESIFMNLYTGSCNLDSVTIENPRAYDTSEFFNDTNALPSNYFIKAKRIKAVISPLKLFEGKLEISSLYMDIDEINCIRVNNATYNLPEFLSLMSGISGIGKEGDHNSLDKFFLSVRVARYFDITKRSDAMNWTKQLDLTFEKTNVTNIPAMIIELENKFDEANAPFIARGFKDFEK